MKNGAWLLLSTCMNLKAQKFNLHIGIDRRVEKGLVTREESSHVLSARWGFKDLLELWRAPRKKLLCQTSLSGQTKVQDSRASYDVIHIQLGHNTDNWAIQKQTLALAVILAPATWWQENVKFKVSLAYTASLHLKGTLANYDSTYL